MARPRLAEPHTCGTPGCGTKFKRGGRVKPTPQCPRCYTRALRNQPLTPEPALPSNRIHITLPIDLAQRLEAYVESTCGSPSFVVRDALVAFLDRAEAESARNRGHEAIGAAIRTSRESF
jgi:Arc/MetJ-type ribon-helix-helix transcriptional regulator